MAADELVGGFVHRLGSFDDAMVWAHELTALAPLTVKAHKLALESLFEASLTVRSSDVVEAARLRAWASRDADEGRKAFLEKRTPRFTGE